MPNVPSQSPIGAILVGLGALIVLVGLLYGAGLLRWFGHLPGDIRYHGAHTRVYMPIVSMLLVSLGLSLVLYLIQRIR